MSLQSRFKKPEPVPFLGARLLSVKDAAKYIAHSEDLMHVLLNDGVIPYVKKGDGMKRAHRLVDRLDLDRFIEKNKIGVL